MKIMVSIAVILFVSIMGVSTLAAADNSGDNTTGGVEATVQYNPLGSHNLLVAYVKFVNHNQYKVHVDWTPLITCEDGQEKEGYGEGFSMDGGGSYLVNIWRSGACGSGEMKELRVKMAVKKE